MDTVTAIIIALLGSGIWSVILDIVKTRQNRMTTEKRMLLALGHDRLYGILDNILKRGYVTIDELENIECLYKAYKELGGNGTCERMYEQVNKLSHTPIEKEKDRDK